MAWYNDRTFVTSFFEVLTEAGVLEDMDDAKVYMKQPYKYNEHYKAWAAAGFPTSDDESWDDFIEALDEEAEESEDTGEETTEDDESSDDDDESA